PGDFRVQLANALDSKFKPREKVANLRALEPRFPGNPSLSANLLRFETQGPINGCKRPEEDILSTEPGKSSPRATDATPEQLAAFDREAAKGEELEPENAYFPFIRSVGLFAGRKDDEAVAALVRASTKPTWEEHYEDE